MKLTAKQHVAASKSLFNAERTGTQIESISATYSNADVDDAYTIAQGVTALKVKDGNVVQGHKIGLTSKAMREMSQAKEPDYGTLTDDYFVLEGATVPSDRLHRALVEVEIAFVLKHDLTGPSVNVAQVIQATDFILPCLEIVDSRQSSRGPTPLVDTIADAASCGFVVLGGCPRRLTDVDIRRIGATLFINGEAEVSGVSAAVMGNPINSVAWLANKLHSYGVPLLAGQVLLSGSFVRAIPFGPGDTLTALFDGLGEVQLSVAK